jgi:D-alanyl-lipoteichoic acid acyltransferase DltB (MBOAT superfamily)
MVIYPNPVQEGETITITKASDEPIRLCLFDLTGIKVFENQTRNPQIQLNKQIMPKGIYFYTVSFPGQKKISGKLIIM